MIDLQVCFCSLMKFVQLKHCILQEILRHMLFTYNQKENVHVTIQPFNNARASRKLYE